MSSPEIQLDYYQVAFTGDEENPTERDLMITRDGKSYLISVTTPGHLEELKAYNRQFDLPVQFDDNFFLMDNLPPTAEELCQKLFQIPTEVLQPFLTEQKLNTETP